MEYETTGTNPTELKDTVAEKRKYNVLNVEDARKAASVWLDSMDLIGAVSFGLPEIDDRYHVWRVPLVGRDSQDRDSTSLTTSFGLSQREQVGLRAGGVDSLLIETHYSTSRFPSQNTSWFIANIRNASLIGI